MKTFSRIHTRKIDVHGRLNIPQSLRRQDGLNNGATVEVHRRGVQIIIQPVERRCPTCDGSGEDPNG